MKGFSKKITFVKLFKKMNIDFTTLSKGLILILFCSFNCTLKAERITILGKVDGKKNDSIRINIKLYHVDYRIIKIDENSYFNYSFVPTNINNFILIGRTEILLLPGDSVFLTMKNDSIVDIAGKYSSLNRVIIELQKNNNMLINNYRSIHLQDFLQNVKDWYSFNLQLIKTNYKQRKISKENEKLLISYLNLKYVYQHYLYLITKRVLDDKEQYQSADTSYEFKQFIKVQDFNDIALSTSVNYTLALNLFLKNQLSIKYDADKTYLMNVFDRINEMNLQNINQDIAYCLFVYHFDYAYSLKNSFYSDADSILRYFSENAFYKENAAYLKNIFNKKYGNLCPQRILSGVELLDTNGNNVQLSNYKDKVVYIKLWNLGCRGCIEAIPAFNELVSSFNDTNIVFLCIAQEKKIDNTQWKDKILQWKNAVSKYKIKGINLISSYGDESGIDKYSNGSLSGYFILGRNNKIIDLKALPPNNNDLKAMLWDVIYTNKFEK